MRNSDLKIKILRLNKLGWKRIARNTLRFGWRLDDAVEEVTETTETIYKATYVSDDVIKVTSEDKVSVDRKIKLVFFRYDNDIPRFSVVKTKEFFYNIFYFIRKILSYIVPGGFFILFLACMFGDSDDMLKAGPGVLLLSASPLIWFFSRIMENVISRSAEKTIQKGW